MAFTVQNGEPSELLTGTSWEWDRHVSEALPSEGWTLTYEFTGPGAIDTIQAVSSSEGDYYEVREDKDFSDRFAGGMYEVSAFVTNGTDRHLIWRGRIYVRDVTADELSTRSHSERVFAAIKDAIEGRITTDTQSFAINGRAFSQIPIEECQRLRGLYAAMVCRERTGGGGHLPEIEIDP